MLNTEYPFATSNKKKSKKSPTPSFLIPLKRPTLQIQFFEIFRQETNLFLPQPQVLSPCVHRHMHKCNECLHGPTMMCVKGVRTVLGVQIQLWQRFLMYTQSKVAPVFQVAGTGRRGEGRWTHTGCCSCCNYHKEENTAQVVGPTLSKTKETRSIPPSIRESALTASFRYFWLFLTEKRRICTGSVLIAPACVCKTAILHTARIAPWSENYFYTYLYVL